MLRFAVGPIPVRVHLTFLLVAVFAFGFDGSEIALWTGAAFVAVLIHELGHASVARAFGAEAIVTIYALGGVTRWVPTRPLAARHRFLVAASGSGLGFVAAAAVWGAAGVGLFGRVPAGLAQLPPWTQLGTAAFFDERLGFAIASFLFVALVWGIVNWLPINGLDGYHMLREALSRSARGAVLTRGISIVTGVGAAVYAFSIGLRFAAIFALILTFSDMFGQGPA